MVNTQLVAVHQHTLFDTCIRRAALAAKDGNTAGFETWESRSAQVARTLVTDKYFALWLLRECQGRSRRLDAPSPCPYTAYLRRLARTFSP